MKILIAVICCLAVGDVCFSRSTFSVIGTPIPSALVQQNYGVLPKGVVAYDLNICNTGVGKESVVSGEIYQALSTANGTLKPIGRQVMLAAILQNRSHSAMTIATVVLNSAIKALSILSFSSHHFSADLLTGAALASMTGQQIVTDLKPVLPANQLEEFETQVLEPALVLDAGSCVERTIFAATANPKTQLQPLNFHVR